jgi:hypothetical protein
MIKKIPKFGKNDFGTATVQLCQGNFLKQVLESIKPNSIFLCLPIFAVKISRFVREENNAIIKKWPSLKIKDQFRLF